MTEIYSFEVDMTKLPTLVFRVIPKALYLERENSKIMLKLLDVDHFSSFRPKSQFSVYYLSSNRSYKSVGQGGFGGNTLCLF